MAELTGVRCLSIGRALARTECGLAFAARAIGKGQAAELQMGLNTVRQSLRGVSEMMPAGAVMTRKILSKVNSMSRDLSQKKKISKARSSFMFETLQHLKQDVDRLFATGAAGCPGGAKKRR